MNLKSHDAPHIRHHENTRTLMLDVILVMLFLYGMAFFYYGPRAMFLGLASTFAALLADILCTLMTRRKPNPRDFSAVVTGMLIPLLMPASVPYHVVVAGALFGILVAKQPFGGVGHNVFNPAAAGFAFAAISFSDALFLFPQPGTWLPTWGALDVPLVNSPAFTLSVGGLPQHSMVDMLLGNFPGPMGATNILVLLACLLYLVLRGTIRWEVPACFFAAAALIALAFPRGGPELGLGWAMRARLTVYELMSGNLLIGGVFMMGDPVTIPKRDTAKIAFAVFGGVLVMLFRRFGGFEDTFAFAVLMLNATVWGFDMIGERFAARNRRKALENNR